MNTALFSQPLVLGSGSPRRAELLKSLGYSFRQLKADIDESYPQHLRGAEIPLYLAKAKAEALAEKIAKDEILVTGDTVVWFENKALEKPANSKEARLMLNTLSGNRHWVYSSYSLSGGGQQKTGYGATEVYFRPLPQSWIDYYVSHYQPTDKAGAYGIQEWLGMVGIEKISGSYFNVMGLPVDQVFQDLQEWSRNA